jgi:putative sterol carrier protein
MPMAAATAAWFADLAQRGDDRLVEKDTGTMRFDLARGRQTDPWLLTIKRGDITVSREDGPADAVLRADEAVFDAIVRGEMNPMAAYLRGVLTMEGDVHLLVALRRLMPVTAQAGEEDRPAAGYARRES